MSTDEEASKKEMPPVDLSLAVNYLPAVACVIKTLWISCMLCMVAPNHALGAFSVVQLMLNLDAVVSSERIFNGNAVLCTVLFSWFVNFLRQGMDSAPVVGNSLCAFWMLFSLAMLLEPNHIRAYVSLDPSPRLGWGESGPVTVDPARLRYGRYVPLLVHTLCVGMLFFVRMDMEPNWLKVMRSTAFAVLCVVWVYVVGVWQRCCASGHNLFTRNLIGRFSPVLFVYPAMALVFCLVCIVCLVCLYVDVHGGGMRCFMLSSCCRESGAEPGVDDAELLRASQAVERPFADRGAADTGYRGTNLKVDFIQNSEEMQISTIEEENEEDIESCFRMAYEERRGAQIRGDV